MYKLYEYKQDDIRIGLIVSDKEQLLYIGSKLYSAKTNITPDKQALHSDITGHGLRRKHQHRSVHASVLPAAFS